MTHPPRRLSPRTFPRYLPFFILPLFSTAPAQAASPDARKFAIPSGAAEQTLRQFSVQSAAQIAYPTDLVRGVPTNAVRGNYPPVEALERMLAGTPLTVVPDEKPGAFAIKKADDPNAQRVAPKTAGDHPTNLRPLFFPTNLAQL